MRYVTFSPEEQTSYAVCILANNLRTEDMRKEFLKPVALDENQVLAIQLHHTGTKKKTTAAEKKQWITEELIPNLKDINVQYLMVTDGEYFKTLANVTKVDAHAGYVLDSPYGDFKIIYCPPLEAVFYDPDKVRRRIRTAFQTLKAHATGTYQPPGADIIEFVEYPQTVTEIAEWLEILIKEDRPLTSDIEAFSLKHYSAGIGTITFCWNEREGICFPVDLGPDGQDMPLEYRAAVRALLCRFYERFNNTLMYHHISYDVTVLIYQLFMRDITDTEGLLYGLEVMLKNWHDTKLITYLATNSCAGNRLGLKDQAQEFAGNYAVEEIKDICKIPLAELLQYNLVDGLSTWYVFNKHYQIMLHDQQEGIYNTIFKPAIMDIIQMQLTGLPVNMERVKIAKKMMQDDRQKAVDAMYASPLVQQFNYQRVEEYVEFKNSTWVKKRTTVSEVLEEAITNEKIWKEIRFNPSSGPQLIKLLYEMIGLPIIETTQSGEPATDKKTLKDLQNHTSDPEVLDLLKALGDFGAVEKILTSTIPAFENAVLGPDGCYYVFGNFNLGGTLSGRLSSSDPNLQNLPASSKYAKLIKWCVQAPKGWVFCGLDFASLEDRISGLTTKDPNKLKVYTDGYDGHCLRAYAYFGNKMPDIDPTSVESINSIAKKYPKDRTISKNPTFALTYQGTYGTLMRNYGFTEELAKKCESAYQELYRVSVDWVNAKLDQAMTDGYVTCAFGLRVRTPLLSQVIRGTKKTPREAEAEGRSAGNALGQSWCLLNSRAGSDFMGKVRVSKHRYDIRICAQIHDANYFLVRDDIEAIMFANEHMVKACQWQNHPDIAHDEVKLEGEFSLFHPDWSQELSLPNGASAEVISHLVHEHVKNLEPAAS